MTPITRHYLDVGGRLVHYRRAGQGPLVVLLHESPRSSAALLPLIEWLPEGLTVFALDTPGYGQSDPLPLGRDTLADFADATAAAIAAIGIGRAPVYGTHTGASIAYMVALRHPDLCALAVLDGFPVFTAQEREEALASYLPPFRPVVDGTHLTKLWSRVRDQTTFFPWYRRGEAARLSAPPAPLERLQAIAMDYLRAGDNYRTAYAGAFASRPLDTITALTTDVLFGARVDDVLLGHLDRLPPECDTARYPPVGPEWASALHARFMAAASGSVRQTTDGGSCRAAYIDLPGGQLHVRRAMGGLGMPLLLLHPLPGSGAFMAGLLDRAAGTRPVVAPDLPGSGDSDRIDGDPAAIMVALCDRLGFGRTGLIGCGTGAILATTLHVRDPDRFPIESLRDVPLPDAVPPPPLRPDAIGTHLLTAWHQVREAAIHGGWERREPVPYDALDADALHAATVELLKARADPTPLIYRLLQDAS